MISLDNRWALFRAPGQKHWGRSSVPNAQLPKFLAADLPIRLRSRTVARPHGQSPPVRATRTQQKVIDWSKLNGHSPRVARFLHLKDKK